MMKKRKKGIRKKIKKKVKKRIRKKIGKKIKKIAKPLKKKPKGTKIIQLRDSKKLRSRTNSHSGKTSSANRK